MDRPLACVWLLLTVLAPSCPVSSPLCTRSRIYISKTMGFAHLPCPFLRCASEYSLSRGCPWCRGCASSPRPPRALWVVPAPQHGRPRAHPRPGFCLRTPSRGKLLSQPIGTLLSSEFVSVVCRVRVTVHRLQHSRKTCSVKLLLLFGELRRQHINY